MYITGYDRYVNVNELLPNLREAIRDAEDYDGLSEDIVYAIDRTPSADVQEVHHSHWNYDSNEKSYYCTHCMRYLPCCVDSFEIVDFEWCPFCGNKMDELYS